MVKHNDIRLTEFFSTFVGKEIKKKMARAQNYFTSKFTTSQMIITFFTIKTFCILFFVLSKEYPPNQK